MLGEGVHPMSVERAATQAGYPVGTLQLSDELNMELMAKIREGHRRAAERDGRTYAEHPADGGRRHDDRGGPPGPPARQGLLRLRRERPARPAVAGPARTCSRRTTSRPTSRTSRTATCSSRRSRPRGASRRASSSPPPRPTSARSWASATRPLTGGAAQFMHGYDGPTGHGLPASSPGPASSPRRTATGSSPTARLVEMAEKGESFPPDSPDASRRRSHRQRCARAGRSVTSDNAVAPAAGTGRSAQALDPPPARRDGRRRRAGRGRGPGAVGPVRGRGRGPGHRPDARGGAGDRPARTQRRRQVHDHAGARRGDPADRGRRAGRRDRRARPTRWRSSAGPATAPTSAAWCRGPRPWEHLQLAARLRRLEGWEDRAQRPARALRPRRRRAPGHLRVQPRHGSAALGGAGRPSTSPSVLLLDEPFDGVDPLGVEATLEVIADARARGAAVLVSTHLRDLAMQACENALVLRGGSDRGGARRRTSSPVRRVQVSTALSWTELRTRPRRPRGRCWPSAAPALPAGRASPAAARPAASCWC